MNNYYTNEMKFDLDSVYGEVQDLFVDCTGHFGVQYKGVPFFKCPFDYTLYQMVIMRTMPDLVIEIGTYKGGGALYIADLLYLIGRGEVHTINIEDQVDSLNVKSHPYIKFFYDGWQGYDLELTKNFKKILIIDDGSHSYPDVIGALHKFSPIITKGSYYIVEDGVITQKGFGPSFEGGPSRAIKEFMTGNMDFIIDRYYCDFFGTNATFNPNGYLKKIK